MREKDRKEEWRPDFNLHTMSLHFKLTCDGMWATANRHCFTHLLWVSANYRYSCTWPRSYGENCTPVTDPTHTALHIINDLKQSMACTNIRGCYSVAMLHFIWCCYEIKLHHQKYQPSMQGVMLEQCRGSIPSSCNNVTFIVLFCSHTKIH